MMTKTVFISSTFEDLKEHRARVWDSLQKLDANIRGMEQFGARKENSLETCLAECELSDIFVGIVAMRYGSIDEMTGKSYSMLEYEKAFETGKDILFFLIDEANARIAPIFVDIDEKRNKLDAFKSLVKERHTIATFASEDELVKQIELSLKSKVSKKSMGKGAENSVNFSESETTINKFLLMPNAYRGEIVDIRCILTSEPFPASKVVCSKFNLAYGKTVGINIRIVEPKISDFTNYLFVEQSRFDRLTLEKNVEIAMKVALKFTDEVISSFKARFVREEFTTISFPEASLFASPSAVATSFMNEKKIIYEPEGTIIAQFVDVAELQN